MAETVAQIRNRLRSNRRVESRRKAPVRRLDPVVERAPEPDPSFVLENQESGKVVVSMPAEEAMSADDFILKMSGRLVEAENANRNGAFWTRDDLEFGMPSIAHGPLNWLHEDQKVIGTLLNPTLVEQSSEGYGPHVRTDAVAWKWMNRKEIASLTGFIKDGAAWLSMECIAQQIQCTGPNGCGKTMPYADAALRSERACEHVRERASHRRFIKPIFHGAAVIVPPTRPGWINADLDLKKDLTSQAEAAAANLEGLTEAQAHGMVAQILAWSNRS